ncbi:rRNA maturation RNase YbeY [Pseudophaeobacter sp.]|uniref:rRNA maturation RNase YbeY n=1 Tax=Pseudophaeobacter sp. TaxID=1971739 RepID=UPI003298D6A5
MNGLDVVIEDGRWNDVGLTGLASVAISATLDHLDLQANDHEVVVLACDDARISALNSEFREKPTPTNVLSWPSVDLEPGVQPDEELGDIAIAYDTCKQESEAQNKQLIAHVTHLLVHATLHLLGYDHINAADADQMEKIEVEILGKLGIADPY